MKVYVIAEHQNNINSILFIDADDFKFVYCSDSDVNDGKALLVLLYLYGKNGKLF